MAKILNEINNILLPRACFGCNTQLFSGERILCTVYRHDVPLTDHNCLEENTVNRIFYGRIPTKKAAPFVFLSKNGLVKNLLHWPKYKNQEQIGSVFGEWCGALLTENDQLKNVGKSSKNAFAPMHRTIGVLGMCSWWTMISPQELPLNLEQNNTEVSVLSMAIVPEG
ncbi:MAG: hypothetical protein NXH90_14785 [Flavobacteriaceae bacterium]|nr:hypothetical protein [Flavobacteriaceae bacterium]